MSKVKSVLMAAALRILKPLIKVLVRNEVSHGEFVALAKRAYVEVVYEHFSIPGKKTTYARVAVLTGLNRKEVVALTKEESNTEASKGTPNRAIRVINGWLNDPEFLAANNEAKILPIQGEQGSFSALVARYSGDITLGAIVDELERIGIVTKLENKFVKLNSEGYIPKDNELEQIRIMSICAADLLISATYNLEQERNIEQGCSTRFQRQVVYKKVPEHLVNQFKEYSDKQSLALLRDYNHWLEERTTQPLTDVDEPTCRVGVGIYYFEQKD